MKIDIIVLAMILAEGATNVQQANAAPTGAATITVTNFGARGNGVSDDTAAIQAAINALELQGGGILRVPSGTYLLNSYSPSPHPWFFYNLRVGSNITIQADPGAEFLQGPGGRAAELSGATEVKNSVLVFGSPNYTINTYQNTNYNGGFYPLQATTANHQSVTLSVPSQSSHFHVGDYVAVYSTTTGLEPWSVNTDGVFPSESTQVTSVSRTGVLGLLHPLARGFPAPVIANVTSLTTVNVGVNNLIVQGAEPLLIQEVFGFTASGNTFISDTSIGGGNDYGLDMNSIRGFNFTNNVVTSAGPSYLQLELPERNSQDVVINSNTFNVSAAGFGEYGAHWTISGNTFSLHNPDASRITAGVAFGGVDVLFSNNHVQGSTSVVPLVTDFVGPAAYGSYVGQIRIVNNTIDCQADQSNCLKVAGADTTVTGNRFNVTGNTGYVILVEGPLPQTVMIQGNSLTVQNGTGIVLNTPGADNSIVSCNTITGAGLFGIYVASPKAPEAGKLTLSGNTVSGFNTALFIDLSYHPATVIDYSTNGCSGQ